MNEYIVIYRGEDGPSIEWMDKETLLERIRDEYWGGSCTVNLEELDHMDLTEYGDTTITIIKGKIVNPTPVTRVQTWEVE